jgi:transposase-like protein
VHAKRRRPGPEFKREAVRLVRDHGKRPLAVARELGVRPDLLHRILVLERVADEPLHRPDVDAFYSRGYVYLCVKWQGSLVPQAQ